LDVDVVLDSDAKGHSYSFGEPDVTCVKENNTDNRAYLAFYILTLVTALIGFCCLVGENGEMIYGWCLVILFVWYIVMEGLRAQQLHKEILDFEGGYDNEIARVYVSFFVGQFCLYCSLLVGLALELFDIPCCKCACACVKTVVVKQRAVIQV